MTDFSLSTQILRTQNWYTTFRINLKFFLIDVMIFQSQLFDVTRISLMNLSLELIDTFYLFGFSFSSFSVIFFSSFSSSFS